jgi:hypothetical protein
MVHTPTTDKPTESICLEGMLLRPAWAPYYMVACLTGSLGVGT